jgi:hypothetical protein
MLFGVFFISKDTFEAVELNPSAPLTLSIEPDE